MITLVKQKSKNKLKVLTRIYWTYKKSGWDISQVNLSRHTGEVYRNNLQLIVFLDYVKNDLCVKSARGKIWLARNRGRRGLLVKGFLKEDNIMENLTTGEIDNNFLNKYICYENPRIDSNKRLCR